jgi:hypothetical protein
MKFILILILIFTVNITFYICSTAYTTSGSRIQTEEIFEDDIDSVIPKHKLHRHPLPLKIFGIDVGNTNDAKIIKQFGEGLYDRDDGHCGARYYSIPSKKLQIYATLGVDRIVDYVAVTYSDYPFEYTKDKDLKSISLPKKVNTKLIGGIGLNDTPEKLIAKYGKPNKDFIENGLRMILYQDNADVWDEVMTYEALFTFRDNKLIRMSIYNGE